MANFIVFEYIFITENNVMKGNQPIYPVERYVTIKMYALYAPIQATYKESWSLNGLAKMKYDKEHKDSLSKYPELKEHMPR